LSDSEILREAYIRNSTHGKQMSKRDKIGAAEHLYLNAGGSEEDRYNLISETLSLKLEVSKKYCAEARKAERKKQKDEACDLWLDCVPQTKIAERLGTTQQNVSNWVQDLERSSEICSPPASRQHFDVWQFQTSDKTAGAQSYFGAATPMRAPRARRLESIHTSRATESSATNRSRVRTSSLPLSGYSVTASRASTYSAQASSWAATVAAQQFDFTVWVAASKHISAARQVSIRSWIVMAFGTPLRDTV
jgi:hypothetical protein